MGCRDSPRWQSKKRLAAIGRNFNIAGFICSIRTPFPNNLRLAGFPLQIPAMGRRHFFIL